MFIAKGTRGIKTEKLQYRLGITVDGIYGSGTKSHVKKWQENNELEVTGQMHDKDWNVMFGCNVDQWTPIGVVVHSMSEYLNHEGQKKPAKDFLNDIGLSVHAFIKPDGMVQSMKKTNERAAHAGVSKHNSLEGLNKYFLGFEILVEGENTYGEFLQKIEKDGCYTNDQFNTSVMLTNTWMEEYNIPVKDVVRHSDVSGDDVRGDGNGKKDPGKGFNWQKFVGKLEK